jgi:hypothetical protein
LLDRIKPMVHRTPIVGTLCREAARLYRTWRARGISRQETFSQILRENAWNGTDSVSGAGSDRLQTRRLILELPGLLRELKIGSLLDLPCGDFFWMRQVDLTGIQYIGGDIVPDLISRNKQYESANIAFRVMDLLHAPLPRVDLVFSRDCLVHLSHMDVFQAVANICSSGSEFLLTTTFTRHGRNRDICTGEWRTLNLELDPFRFPKPLKVLEEGCTEAGEYVDKSLGLWRIADLKESLARRGRRYKGLELSH